MGFGTLPKPGSELGPCDEPCEHKDCKQTREQAASICRLCGNSIGYDTPFFRDPNFSDAVDTWAHLVHANCLHEASEVEWWVDLTGQVFKPSQTMNTAKLANSHFSGPFTKEKAEAFATKEYGAICAECGKRMLLANGCTTPKQITLTQKTGGVPAEIWADFDRIPAGNEGDGIRPEQVTSWRCHDCGCKAGYLHHLGCDAEECPQCGGQLISCGCWTDGNEDWEAVQAIKAKVAAQSQPIIPSPEHWQEDGTEHITAHEWNLAGGTPVAGSLPDMAEMPASVRHAQSNLSHYMRFIAKFTDMKWDSDNESEVGEIIEPPFTTMWYTIQDLRAQLKVQNEYAHKIHEVVIKQRLEIESLKRRLDDLTAGK